MMSIPIGSAEQIQPVLGLKLVHWEQQALVLEIDVRLFKRSAGARRAGKFGCPPVPLPRVPRDHASLRNKNPRRSAGISGGP